MDILLALLPWKVIPNLNMRRTEKIGVALAMSMGIFAGAAATVKVIQFRSVSGGDFTYEGTSLVIWGITEAAVTIAAASIPQLRVLVREVNSSLSLRRITVSLQKVRAFGDNLSPYFKIMEIVCGSHPEWANIAMGALRFILQLASQYVSFFEKLCNVVETVNARLPRYQEVYDRLIEGINPPRPRLKISLQQTYISLFEVFQDVARVFSRPDGRVRKPPFVIVDLMWKPLDLRFHNVLEKISFYQSIVKEELDFAAMERLQEEIGELREVQEEHATNRAQVEILKFLTDLVDSHDHPMMDRFRSSIIRWIDSPEFKENLGDAQDERVESTAEWIFDDPVFVSWRNSSVEDVITSTPCPSSLLWINEDMQEQGFLHEIIDLATMVQHVAKRAEGMFLWARVMVAYLNSPALTRERRIDTIMEQTPRGLERLEDLYCRIQDRIDSLDGPSRELAHKALLWVAYAQLSSPELKEAIFPEGSDADSGDGSLASLGVLSRWMGKKFADIPYYQGASKRGKPGKNDSYIPAPPKTMIEIHDACSGWTVTYEIFSIETTNSESVLLTTIPLDATDVEILTRDTLRPSLYHSVPHSGRQHDGTEKRDEEETYGASKTLYTTVGNLGQKHIPSKITTSLEQVVLKPHKELISNRDRRDEEIAAGQIMAPANKGEIVSQKSNIALSVDPGTSVTSSAIMVSYGPDRETSLTRCDKSSHEVQIHRKSGTEESSTSVVKLPQFIPSRGMSAQVTAPDPGDNPALYKVILNASQSKTYVSGQPSPAQYLPLIRGEIRRPKEVLSTYGDSLRRSFEENVLYEPGVTSYLPNNDTSGIEVAVAAAKEAGLAVVVLGSGWGSFDPAAFSNERTDGEGYAHADLGFPELQQELRDAVLDAGVPTVLVMNGGQVFVLNESTKRSDAIFHAFLGGEFTGDVLVEILFGDVNPSGKLTMSIPEANGQFPNRLRLPGLRRRRRLRPRQSVRLAPAAGEPNTGNMGGKEVVQLYYRPGYSIIQLPVMRLIRFQKVEVPSGESKEVTLTVSYQELGYYVNGKWHSQGGNYTFWIGNSYRDEDLQRLNAALTP
ncbi:hypothetical protein DL771_000665 [Monosporascus sp. 5C6A]|nr:hypothetical protein DL771_000665 [Monosporascus sp. 5C6A]